MQSYGAVEMAGFEPAPVRIAQLSNVIVSAIRNSISFPESNGLPVTTDTSTIAGHGTRTQNERNIRPLIATWAHFHKKNKRRGWDSNPRALSDKRFSRPPRCDRFDTSPEKRFPTANRVGRSRDQLARIHHL